MIAEKLSLSHSPKNKGPLLHSSIAPGLLLPSFPPQFSDMKRSSKSSLTYPLTTMGGATQFTSLSKPPTRKLDRGTSSLHPLDINRS